MFDPSEGFWPLAGYSREFFDFFCHHLFIDCSLISLQGKLIRDVGHNARILWYHGYGYKAPNCKKKQSCIMSCVKEEPIDGRVSSSGIHGCS